MENNISSQNEKIKQEVAEKKLLPHTSAPWQQYLLYYYLISIPVKKTWRILDAGCGIGNNLETILKFNRNISAFDYSEKALSFAKERYEGHEIRFKTGDLHEIPFPKNSFDLVVCTEAIEHCKNPSKVVSELGRIVKNDGYIVLSTQNHFNLSAPMKWFFEKILGMKNWDVWGTHSHDEGYENYLTAFQLHSYCLERKYKILDHRGADYLNAWFAWLPFVYKNYRILDKYPIFWLGRFPLLKYLGMDYFLLMKKELL